MFSPLYGFCQCIHSLNACVSVDTLLCNILYQYTCKQLIVLPFLRIGDMFACFHSMGSLPVLGDVLNIVDSGILMQSANSFMTLR